jgi:hypothetical protein
MTEYTRWSDWSQIKQWRDEGKGRVPDLVKRRRKVNRIRAELGLTKYQAQQRLRFDDSIEVADHEVDNRPAALRPEVTAGD